VANSLTEEFIFFDPNADLRQMSLKRGNRGVVSAITGGLKRSLVTGSRRE
jgi:hypothetical protein